MATNIPSLVKRVHDLLQKHGPWFELVGRWYDNVKTTKKVMLKMWVPSAPTCRPLLSVNGQFLEEGDRKSAGHRRFWMVPSSSFRVGDNDVFLWVDRDRGPPVNFGAIAVEHDAALPDDVRKDSRPKPLPTSQVSVTFRLGEGFRPDSDRWQTEIHHDTAKLHLHLAEYLPKSFTLAVAALLPGAGMQLDFEVLWEQVDKLVKDKIEEYAKDLLRRAAQGDPQRRAVEMDIEQLKSYQKLHRVHLYEAAKCSDADTLADIIARTESIQELVDKVLPAEPVEPALTDRPAKTARRGMSAAGKFCLFLVLMGALGGIAWSNGWIDRNTVDRIQAALRSKGGATAAPAKEKEKELLQALENKKAQTGEVQVSLFWFNKNDLDLHVVTPNNHRLFFGNPRSDNGQLDVDMNAGGYGNASDKAIENIFWPQGQAPRGHYKVIVNHYHNQSKDDTRDPTPFTVRLVVRGETRWFHGEVVNNDPGRREKVVAEFDVQ